MTCRDPRLHIEAGLAKLEALPDELAERHLGWRLIEAFVARDPSDLLFWSVAFARYEGAGAAAATALLVHRLPGSPLSRQRTDSAQHVDGP